MLVYVSLVVQQGGGQSEGELLPEAPGHPRGQKGVGRPGSPAPGKANPKVAEWVGGTWRHQKGEAAVVERLEAAAIPAKMERDIAPGYNAHGKPPLLAKDAPIVVIAVLSGRVDRELAKQPTPPLRRVGQV